MTASIPALATSLDLCHHHLVTTRADTRSPDQWTTYDSPLGRLILAAEGTHLCGAWFAGQRHFDVDQLTADKRRDDLHLFKQAKRWLDQYFSGKNPSTSDLPLRPRGTTFRQEVWSTLLTIPYGEVVTYAHVSERMNRPPGFGRAIGGAVAHNPISVIIPCHRVVGASGALTGYAGGLPRKIALLEREGIDPENLLGFHSPVKKNL